MSMTCVLPSMKKMIIRYIVESTRNSMLFFEVNGTPEKRIFRIYSFAVALYKKMSFGQKAKLFIKILIKTILNK